MKKEQVIALLFAALLAVGATTISSSANSSASAEAARLSTYSQMEDYFKEGEREIVRSYKSLGSVKSKNPNAYTRLEVKISGNKLSVKGVLINGEAYLPFRAASAALGANYSYSSSSRSSVMRASGLVINAGDGCYTVYANDRALFSENPVVIMNDGRMYIPASIFAKAVGMSLSVGEAVELKGSYAPLAHASKFYREDEVFWLARIIHAESRGEPLLGKIAVGDIVLNRVRSNLYPNTIYGVIFDKKYGVQFSPILDGSIYNTPDFNSVLAAKICLEGYNISPEALFFLEPSQSTSSWIPNNRTYLFTIGRHDFYK